ncbi:MAG TPA: phosphodiester glycosidase family protein [Pseudolabrys sp.]
MVKNTSKLVLALFLLLIRAVSVRAESAPCQRVTYEQSEYTVCEVDLRRQSVRLFWKKPDGQPYGYPSSLPRAFGNSGRLLFATNGGMYHPDNSPVGLYVEGGRELVRANTSAGPGNFHMRPNGVFYVTGEIGGVVETRLFIKQRPQVDFATQSGPMLVIDGKVHARFARYGGSRKYRAGVGSRDPNSVVFAVSESEVSFGEFARLFRDKLRSKNALFLDGGSATSFYSPALRRNSNFLPLGPIIGVYGPD